MVDMQYFQSISHIVFRKSSVFPRTRVSLVFETSGERTVFGVPPHSWDSVQVQMGLLTMLICSHVPLQGSKYLAVGQEHQMQRGLRALPVCRTAALFPSAPLSWSGLDGRADGRLRQPQATNSQHRPAGEDPGQKHTDGCFLFVFKRELYWNEILLIGKILPNKPAKDILKYL